MSRPGIEPGPPQWEASTQKKKRIFATWLPQCMCYMNINEYTWTAQGCRSLARHARHQQSICQPPRHQVLASLPIHCQAGERTTDNHYEENGPRSSLSYTRGPRTDIFWPGIEPGPPWWEASTLEKSNSNSFFRNIYIWARDRVFSPYFLWYRYLNYMYSIQYTYRTSVWCCSGQPSRSCCRCWSSKLASHKGRAQ